MNIHQLKVFNTVCEKRQMTQAAAELGISQPAVSRVIRDLESELDIRLFERIGTRLVLTEAGEQLHYSASQIERSMVELERNMSQLKAAPELFVGSTLTIGIFDLPQIAATLKEEHPEIRLRVQVGSSSSILDQIRQGRMDAALLEEKMDEDHLIFEKIGTDEMCLIVPNTHPFAKRKQVTFDELKDQEWLLREPGSAARNYLDALFESRQIDPHVLWSSTSTEAIIEGVKNGLGLAIVSRPFTRRPIEAHEVTEVRIENADLTRTSYLVLHEQKILTRPLSLFLALCKSFFARKDQSAPHRVFRHRTKRSNP